MADKKITVEVVLRGDKSAKELAEKTAKNMKTELDSVLSKVGPIARSVGGVTGNVGGAISGMVSSVNPVAAVAVGIGAAVGILKLISDKITEMKDTLKAATPSLKGMQDRLDTMYNLVLKPIGDIMTMLMRPFLMLMMKRLQAAMQTLQPTFAAIAAQGGTPNKEQMDTITSTVEGALTDFAAISQVMNSVIGPLAGQIAGFQTAIGSVFNNWLTGVSDFFSGVLKGLSEDWSKVSPELKAQLDILKTQFTSIDWARLPQGVRDTLENVRMQYAEQLKNSPDALAGEIKLWQGKYPTELANLPADFLKSLKGMLTDNDDSISSMIKKAGSEAKDPIAEAAKSTFNDIFNAIKGAANSAFGSALPVGPGQVTSSFISGWNSNTERGMTMASKNVGYPM